MICDVVINCLQDWPEADVHCAPNGPLGAQKLREGDYDLALIDGTLPGISGMQLAEIAADEKTSVLILSGHPELNQTLQTFGYPYLPKPFSLQALLSASRQAIIGAEENIRCVKDAAAQSRCRQGD